MRSFAYSHAKSQSGFGDKFTSFTVHSNSPSHANGNSPAFCQYALSVGDLDGCLASSFAILCHTPSALLCCCIPALQLRMSPLD